MLLHQLDALLVHEHAMLHRGDTGTDGILDAAGAVGMGGNGQAVELGGVTDGLHLLKAHLLVPTVVPRLITPPVDIYLMKSAPYLML